MAINTFYPCNPNSQSIPAQSSLCIKCNTNQSFKSCCTSGSSKNSGSQAASCDSYCNTGCNTRCTDSYSQTLCGTNHQSMRQHPDIGEYPGEHVKQNDFIYEKWSIKFFQDLNMKLTLAETIGVQKAQGSTGSFENPQKDEVITAKFYNDIEKKFEGFNINYPRVQKDDLITAAIANAIEDAYNSATFKVTTCDVCNTKQHLTCTCSCNCNCGCSCSCNCGCSCPCSKPCNCQANT